MKRYLVILLVASLALNLTAQDESALLGDLSGKLEAYKQLSPLEKVFLQSDKEIYTPGEIIWFSGCITDRTFNLFSGSSVEITAALYDASGKMIKGDKFPVDKGIFQGDFLLEKEMPLGSYYLAAWTPWQNNPDNVFIKPLVVVAFYKSDARVSPTDLKKIYQAGSKTTIDLQAFENNGKPADRFTINYEIRHRDQKLTAGKVRSESGKIAIPVTIPAETGKDPLEIVVSHPRNLWNKKWALKTNGDQLDIRFYVEGNTLSGRVPQKTVFYATTGGGIPVDLEADITDSSGRIISKTKTFRSGFGMFPFRADPGEQCKMTITSEYGKGQSFDLPRTGTGSQPAITLSKADDEFITVDLLAHDSNPQEFGLTATRGFQLLWAADIRISGNSRIRIPTDELGSGIILLSLFNTNKEVQSTRLVYLPDKGQPSLDITGVENEAGKIRLTVRSLDGNGQPLPANVILSVTDTLRRISSGKYTVRESFFPDGELRNPVEGFINNETFQQQNEQDFIMIGNELNDFSWGKVLKEPVDTTNKALVSGGSSGRVTDKKGNPVPNARVALLNNRDMKMYNAAADGKGNFKIPFFQPIDINDLSATATDENQKGSFLVIMDPVFSMQVGDKVRRAHFRFQEGDRFRGETAGYLTSNPGLVSDPPVIKTQAAEPGPQRPEPYKIMLESGTNILEVIRSMRPYNLMGGQIVFYGTINSINAQSGALIVIDGQRLGTQADVLNNISPYDVETINVSLDPMEIQRYTGLNNVGLIEITTKRGKIQSSETPVTPKKGEEPYLEGYRIPRNFLTTDALREIGGKDVRTTLYWNPALETGTSGSSTFSIPLSEVKSGFVITAELITPAGLITRARALFSVQ